MGDGPGRFVKTRGPPRRQVEATHIELTSPGSRPHPVGQISREWDAAGPGPLHVQTFPVRPGRAQPIKFQHLRLGPARPGTPQLQNSRPGAARPISFSDQPGPAGTGPSMTYPDRLRKFGVILRNLFICCRFRLCVFRFSDSVLLYCVNPALSCLAIHISGGKYERAIFLCHRLESPPRALLLSASIHLEIVQQCQTIYMLRNVGLTGHEVWGQHEASNPGMWLIVTVFVRIFSHS